LALSNRPLRFIKGILSQIKGILKFFGVGGFSPEKGEAKAVVSQ